MTIASGTVVWAKLAGYPYWPSRMIEEDELDESVRNALGEQQPGEELVWFFSSNNCAYVIRSSIELWEDNFEEKSTNKKARKNTLFVKAIKEAQQWLQDHPVDSNSNNKEEKEGEDEDTKDNKRAKKTETTKKETKPARKSSVSRQKEDDKKLKDEQEQTKEGEEDGKQESHREKSVKKKNKDSPRKRKEEEDLQEQEKFKKVVEKDDSATAKKRLLSSELEKKESKKLKGETPPPSPAETDIIQLQSEKSVDSHLESSVGKKKPTPTTVSLSLRTICKHPVAKYFKYELTKTSEGVAYAKASIPNIRESKEEVLSCLGALNYLIDITAYAACATILYEGDSGLTQDLHVSVLSPNLFSLGTDITIKANVMTSKSVGLLFVAVEVFANSKQIITATVTKTSLEYPFLAIKN